MEEKLIIDVARLGAEGESLSGEIDDAVLEMDGELLRPFGGIRYSLSAQLFGSELLVRGTLAQGISPPAGGEQRWTTSPSASRRAKKQNLWI